MNTVQILYLKVILKTMYYFTPTSKFDHFVVVCYIKPQWNEYWSLTDMKFLGQIQILGFKKVPISIYWLINANFAYVAQIRLSNICIFNYTQWKQNILQINKELLLLLCFSKPDFFDIGRYWWDVCRYNTSVIGQYRLTISTNRYI